MCASVSADSQLCTLRFLSQSWKSFFVCEKIKVFQTVLRLERRLHCGHLNSETGENMLQVMTAIWLSLQCEFSTTSTSLPSHGAVHKHCEDFKVLTITYSINMTFFGHFPASWRFKGIFQQDTGRYLKCGSSLSSHFAKLLFFFCITFIVFFLLLLGISYFPFSYPLLATLSYLL
jgi:hypothetical protein